MENLKIAKRLVNNKRTDRYITTQEIKLNYRAIIIETELYWNKNDMLTRKWNKHSDIILQTYRHLFFTKTHKVLSREKKSSSTNNAGLTGQQYVEE